MAKKVSSHMSYKALQDFTKQLPYPVPIYYRYLRIHYGTSREHHDGLVPLNAAAAADDELALVEKAKRDPEAVLRIFRNASSHAKCKLQAVTYVPDLLKEAAAQELFGRESLMGDLLALLDCARLSEREFNTIQLAAYAVVDHTRSGAKDIVARLKDNEPRVAFAAGMLLTYLLAVGPSRRRLIKVGALEGLVGLLKHANPFCRGVAVIAFSNMISPQTHDRPPVGSLDGLASVGIARPLLKIITDGAGTVPPLKEHGVFINVSWSFRDSEDRYSFRLMSDAVPAAAILVNQLIGEVNKASEAVVDAGAPGALLDALRRYARCPSR